MSNQGSGPQAQGGENSWTRTRLPSTHRALSPFPSLIPDPPVFLSLKEELNVPLPQSLLVEP